ncbi:uncharacterized protein E0L32_010398 [Thyridium curvatum]|uniref:Uncharacterized protein n=1 Tax=Thyridium curvatum TaxID=1093900 RepID=A0A507AKH5_9PEZI|nr:uncharacterized protein E0L32_010398 [Thyridium curvatum]TPX07943.1 hypothetical protein E0L32_010398 [Thyridium curvatum]
MFSFLRSPLPPRTNRAADNPIIYEDGASFLEFRESGSKYLLKNMHPPFDPNKPRSIMVPPFHYHIHQAEHFLITEGTCHLFKDTKDKPWMVISADEPGAQKTAVIPKQIYHTLNNASSTKPMVIDVSLTPEDYEGEQRFFRNFFGYLDDCRKAGQPPSKFQLLVFLKSSDTPVGINMSFKWLGRVVSRVYLSTMAWWGYWILGYKETYPEYYAGKKSR